MLEKPMANSAADAERIIRAIDGNGVKCFHPTLRALGDDLFIKLKELTTADGQLGSVRRGFFHLVGAPFIWADWFKDRGKCVPIAEFGAHIFDTFAALADCEPASVMCDAIAHEKVPSSGEMTSMTVYFEDDRDFRITMCWDLSPEWGYSVQDFHLVCERGVIVHNWWSADWYSDKGKESYASDRRSGSGNHRKHYLSLIDAIESGNDVSPNERDGLRYVRIIDAAVRSAVSGERAILTENS